MTRLTYENYRKKKKRTSMPVSQRAKIFAPYDALEGFFPEIHKKDKIYVPAPQLSEDALEELDRTLRDLTPGGMASCVWYENGRFRKLTGILSRVDRQKQTLTLAGTEIPMGDIRKLAPAAGSKR